MEQVRRMKLPIAGRIQHGEQLFENGRKKVVEYGYFISKVKNSNLTYLENRFNEKYNKVKTITIRIVSENPFFTRMARYNQSGAACYYNLEKNEGKQKVSGVWQKHECNTECSHRIVKEGEQKPACNREGHFFFMIPDICSDRLWNMIITGQESIDNLKGYFEWQKSIGNSIIGDYLICLGQKEQTTKEGKKFNNYVLEIIKKENVNSTNTASENNTKQETQNISKTSQISKQEQKANISQKQEPTQNEMEIKKTEEAARTTEKKVTKKTISAKEKKQKPVKQGEPKIEDTKSEAKDETPEQYYFIETKTEKVQKNGKLIDYVVARFMNEKDQTIDVFISGELARELIECDIGTIVELDLQKAGEKTFTKNIKYVQKCLKNVAA